MDIIHHQHSYFPVTPPLTKRLQHLMIRSLLSVILALATAVLCSLVWGLLAFITHTVYLVGAAVIGMVVTYALLVPFKESSSRGLMILVLPPTLVLTLVSVISGSAMYYVLHGVARLDMGVSAAVFEAAGLFVTQDFTHDGLAVLWFGLVGAMISLIMMARNKNRVPGV